jgi:hypothetical protein
MQNENVNKYQGANDDDLRKLGQPKLAKAGWGVFVIQSAKMRDASTGKWGINVSYSPANEMSAEAKIKRNVRVYNTLWAWFKNPADKKTKPADSFGLFEQFVRTHGVTMPSDGSSVPALPKRNAATGKLEIDGSVVDKLAADQAKLKYNRWLDQLFRELWRATDEPGDGDHPLKGYAVFAKIEYNESGGNTYANITKMAATLPEDAVLVDPFAKTEDTDVDDSEDEN